MLVLALAAISAAAQAEGDGYYVPPAQAHSSLAFVISNETETPEAEQQPVKQAAPIKFTETTGGFRFDPATKTLSNLRIAITVGSLVSPDRDVSWAILGSQGLDVNLFEEIVLEQRSPVVISQEKTDMECRITLHGVLQPFLAKVTLQGIEDNALGMGFIGKNQNVTISLTGTIKLMDHGIQAIITKNKYFGDHLVLAVNLKGTKS